MEYRNAAATTSLICENSPSTTTYGYSLDTSSLSTGPAGELGLPAAQPGCSPNTSTLSTDHARALGLPLAQPNDFDNVRHRIEQLYLVEGMNLETVMDVMRRERGFRAT
jgi:Clr5 domain